MASENDIKEFVNKWLEWDPNEKTKREIEGLVAAGEWKELSRRMHPRISFGTAGLRAEMQAGFAFMNTLTVLQASQGLCRYLVEQFGSEEVQARGVVVGFDGRHNSRSFAHTTAAAFLSQGVKVWLFSDLVPTPFVPFGVLHLKAIAGIMVTASHNPKQDNGYKVYWNDGCQIVEPHDRGISRCIAENQVPWSDFQTELALLSSSTSSSSSITETESSSSTSSSSTSSSTSTTSLLIDPLSDVSTAYFERISSELCFEKARNERNPDGVKFAFTPMHGVGGRWTRRAFESFGLPSFIPVAAQFEPDPDFPTVAFPNPEEGKGALQLAMETAEAAGASIILANDPDADRLAVAERSPADGSWKILTGNEIGALLADHMWRQTRRQHPELRPEQCFMVNSTVSSKFIAAMAAKEGFHYHETLTGFKWIGSRSLALTKEGQHFLFAFEEAIGFMVGTMGWDKDGVRAAAVFAELALDIYATGRTVVQHLQQLYATYGYFVSKNSYFFNHDPPVMYALFERMRTLGAAGGYPSHCGDFAIRAVRDLMTGLDTSQPDGRAILPISKSSPMTTFYFENGAVVTIRGSGTEPKLKYYAELSGPDPVEVAATLDKLVAAIIEHFLQPEINHLKPPNH